MLDLDLVTIGFQILNFLILAAGLYFLLFKPVMKGMKERAETKAQLMQELQNDKTIYVPCAIREQDKLLKNHLK